MLRSCWVRRFAVAAAVSPANRITPRATNFSQWYQDIIAAGDLIDSAPVKGCVILKPGGFGIWEEIQRVSPALLGESV